MGVTGRDMKAVAFAKCATSSWNVAASVTKGIRSASDGGLKHSPVWVEDRSFGETFLGAAEQGDTNPPDVTLQASARYEDHNYILEALAMGSPAAVALVTSAAGQVPSFRHVIDIAPSINGLCATFAVDRQLYVDELVSGKVYGFSESGGSGGVIMQSFRVLGSQVTDISSVNINSTVHGANFPALGNKVFRKQGVFRMNAQGGGSLVVADAIPSAEALEFTFERPQDRSFGYGSPHILEPIDNDYPEPGFRVTFARMNTVSASSLRAAMRLGTVYKCDWTYTGAFINSTDRYSKLVQFPYVELQDFETPASGAAAVKPVAMFRAKKAASAPTGMTGVTMPFRITRIMANSAHAFA